MNRINAIRGIGPSLALSMLVGCGGVSPAAAAPVEAIRQPKIETTAPPVARPTVTTEIVKEKAPVAIVKPTIEVPSCMNGAMNILTFRQGRDALPGLLMAPLDSQSPTVPWMPGLSDSKALSEMFKGAVMLKNGDVKLKNGSVVKLPPGTTIEKGSEKSCASGSVDFLDSDISVPNKDGRMVLMTFSSESPSVTATMDGIDPDKLLEGARQVGENRYVTRDGSVTVNMPVDYDNGRRTGNRVIEKLPSGRSVRHQDSR